MSTPTRTKIAVASFAHLHAAGYVRALLADSSVQLLASDPDGAHAPDEAPRGRALAELLGVDYVDTYEELFAWGPDAAIITSENARHRDLVERAAAVGAHVLCEKPLATELVDAHAMLDACDQAGVILMVAYPVRFAPQVTALRGHVDAGRLGDVFAIVGTNNGKIPVDQRQWFTDPKLAGGGALVDHVVHCADLIDALTGGARAQTVYAAANAILHAEKKVKTETGGIVTVTYDNGLIATIDCSWSLPDSAPTWGGLTLKVTGTRGTVLVDPFAERVNGIDRRGSVWLSYATDSDALMIAHFLAAVRTSGPAQRGSTPRVQPQPDGGVGLRTLEIVDAARRSAALGQPVTVAGAG